MIRIAEKELSYPGHDGRYHYKGAPVNGLVYTLFPNGAVRTETEFRDGVEWGLQRIYRREGGLESERTFAAGHVEGYSRTWHPNGQLELEQWCHIGLPLRWRRWDPEGNLVEDSVRPESDPQYQNMLQYRRIWRIDDSPIPLPPEPIDRPGNREG